MEGLLQSVNWICLLNQSTGAAQLWRHLISMNLAALRALQQSPPHPPAESPRRKAATCRNGAIRHRPRHIIMRRRPSAVRPSYHSFENRAVRHPKRPCKLLRGRDRLCRRPNPLAINQSRIDELVHRRESSLKYCGRWRADSETARRKGTATTVSRGVDLTPAPTRMSFPIIWTC